MVAALSNFFAMIYISRKQFEDQMWFLLSVLVAILYKALILDVLKALMGNALGSLFKVEGYWYDKELHEDYYEFYTLK